jgi:hypothetical protein
LTKWRVKKAEEASIVGFVRKTSGKLDRARLRRWRGRRRVWWSGVRDGGTWMLLLFLVSFAVSVEMFGDVLMVDVFRYLCAEMACMGIRLNVSVT